MIDPAEAFLSFIGAGPQATPGVFTGTNGTDTTNSDAVAAADGALAAFASQLALDPAALSTKAPDLAAALQEAATAADGLPLSTLTTVAPLVLPEGSAEDASVTIDPAALEAIAEGASEDGKVTALSGLLAGAFTPVDAPVANAPVGPAVLPASVISALQGALPAFKDAGSAAVDTANNTGVQQVDALASNNAPLANGLSALTPSSLGDEALLSSLATGFARDTAATSVFLAAAPVSPGSLAPAPSLTPTIPAAPDPLTGLIAGTQSSSDHLIPPGAYLNSAPKAPQPLQSQQTIEAPQISSADAKTQTATLPAGAQPDALSKTAEPTVAPVQQPAAVLAQSSSAAPAAPQTSAQVDQPVAPRPDQPAAPQPVEAKEIDPVVEVDPRDEKPRAVAVATPSTADASAQGQTNSGTVKATTIASSIAPLTQQAQQSVSADVNPIGVAMAAQGLPPQQRPLDPKAAMPGSTEQAGSGAGKGSADGVAFTKVDATAGSNGHAAGGEGHTGSQSDLQSNTAGQFDFSLKSAAASEEGKPQFQPAQVRSVPQPITLEGFAGFNPSLLQMTGFDGGFSSPIADMPGLSSASATAPASPSAATAAVATQQVSVAISKHAKAGEQSFAMRLDPPELGRVSVSLTFAGGKASADILAERPETLQLLQRDQKALETALEEAGHDVDKGSISFGLEQHDGESAGKSRAQEARDAQQHAQNNGVTDQDFGDETNDQLTEQSDLTDAATLAALVGGRLPLSGLDIRV